MAQLDSNRTSIVPAAAAAQVSEEDTRTEWMRRAVAWLVVAGAVSIVALAVAVLSHNLSTMTAHRPMPASIWLIPPIGVGTPLLVLATAAGATPGAVRGVVDAVVLLAILLVAFAAFALLVVVGVRLG